MSSTKIKKINTEKMVITSEGLSKKITECRKINQIYYFIGDIKLKNSGECYKITEDGTETYYRKTNPNLVWDFEKEQYMLKTANHILGIVGIDKDGSFEKGWFTINKLKNIPLGGNEWLFSEETLEKNGYYWNSIQGNFVKTSTPFTLNGSDIKNAIDGGGRNVRKGYQSFPKDVYNAADMPIEEVDKMKNSWLKENGKDSVFDKFFFDYTIGAEIETAMGMIPENLLFRYGLLPLKDGSIPNHEYTTTIIKKNPFFLLTEIFKTTNKYTISNQFCSLHYHIGGAPKTKEFTVAFWSLYYRLQDSLDILMSPYKRELDFLANKIIGNNGGNRGAKDHCKRIPALYQANNINVQETFDNILLLFNDGVQPKPISLDKLLYQHSKQGQPKWDFNSRYYSVNLIPFLFENKQTIEFRLHTGTTNFYKAFAWLMICIALLRFAEQNTDMILAAKEKIRLIDILSVFDNETKESDFLIKWLKEYISYRSKRYANLIIEHNMYGDEFTNDNKFVFGVNGMTPLTFK